MNISFVLGFVGSITASTLFFPQVYTAYKTRHTKDLSWATMYIGLLNGVVWTSYGFIKNDPFIYITNTLLLSAIIALTLLKKKFG